MNKNIEKQKLQENYFCIIGIIIFFSVFFYLIYYMSISINSILDDDMSAELILSELLSRERKIMSKNWFYSTELRVFNMQLIFTPLFWLFKSWHLVRIVGTTVLIVCLLLSFLYVYKQLGLDLKYWSYFATGILVPFSSEYYYIVLMSGFYIPHIIITFLTLGLLVKSIKSYYISVDTKKFYVRYIVLCVIALVAGLGGIRQMIILYVPIFIAAVIYLIYKQGKMILQMKLEFKSLSFHFFAISFILLIFNTLGYLVNAFYLSRQYSFSLYEPLQFINFSWSRMFDTCLDGWMHLFGYRYGTLVFHFSTLLHNAGFIFTVALLIIVLICILKENIFQMTDRLIVLFFVIGIGVLGCVFGFTNQFYVTRYLVPIFIIFYLLIAIWVNKSEYKIKKIFMGVLFLLYLFCLMDINSFPKLSEKNLELMEISSIAENQGYKSGYSTFWNSNVIVEFTNGDIEMWILDLHEHPLSELKISESLQYKNHLTVVPRGKLFLLIDKNGETAVLLKNAIVLYESDKYILYGFDTFDEMKREIINSVG